MSSFSVSVLELDRYKTKISNALWQMERKEMLQLFVGLCTAKKRLGVSYSNYTGGQQDASRMPWAFLLTRTILFFLLQLCLPRWRVLLHCKGAVVCVYILCTMQVGAGPILKVLVPIRTQIPKQLMIRQPVVIRKASAASLVQWTPHLK